MQHSDQPYQELDRARMAIEGMRQAKRLEDLEEFWKEYLRRLERVWFKSVNHFGKSPRWNGWQAKYLKLRKSDPLLSYFVNARGADEHTVGEITNRDPGGLKVRLGPTGRVKVDSIVIENGVAELRGVQGGQFEFAPASVTLLPITNRNVVFPVPDQHLSQPINPQNLIEIAEKGIAFYAAFLDEAEAFFVD